MRPLRSAALILTALVLVSISWVGAPEAGAFDYVENGDFERGTDGWSAPGSALFDTLDTSTIGGSGSAGRLTLAASASSARQASFAGTPAGQYLFSARVRLSSASMIAYAQVSSNPSVTTVRLDAPQIADAWIQLEGVVDVVGFTNVSFTIGVSGSPGDQIIFDDVRFNGSDPATMTPSNTAVPPTSSHTPLPPIGTRTPKPTNTPKPTSTPPPDQLENSTTATAAGDAPPSSGLENPGFENVFDGSPAIWEKYGGSLSSSTSPVRSGSYAGRFESTTESTKWLFQTVQISPGQAYAFDAWLLQNDPGIASAFLRISWYASPDGSGTALGTADSSQRLDAASPEWRHLTTGAVAAPADALSAKVRILLQPTSSARAALYVDDVSFGGAALPAVAVGSVAPAGAPEESSADRRPGAAGGALRERAANQLVSEEQVVVVINEVMYDATTNPDSAGEWIEIYNPGDRSVSLEGWVIADNSSVDVIDALTVAGRGYAILAADSFRDNYGEYQGALATVVGAIGNSLGNEGDVVVLASPDGRFVDAVSWGANNDAFDPAIADVPEGHSIERREPGADSDTAEDFIDNESPSPGTAYRATQGLTTGDQTREGRVQVIRSHSRTSFVWLPWALAAGSIAILAGVASWRLLPSVAQRIRHT